MIVENWLDSDLSDVLEKEFLYNTPHHYGHKAHEYEKNVFYATTLNQRDPLIRYLFDKLKKTVNSELILHKVYINVQHPNMESGFHVDEGNMTAIYMVTGSGNFQIKNQKDIKFKKNKLICFDATKLHRGLAPTKGVRITLAFKTTKIKKVL